MEVMAAGQLPIPSQLAAAVAVPMAQLGMRQTVIALGMAHAAVFMPSHAPLQVEPSPAHAGRPPIGAPMVGKHLPSAPIRLHAPH